MTCDIYMVFNPSIFGKETKGQKRKTNKVSVCIKVLINRKSDFDPLLSGIQSSVTYGE